MAYDATKPANNSSPVAADMRENFRALKEDDIVEGVAANGIITTMIANASVTQAKLKTSQGSVQVSIQAESDGYTAALPGGEYGFTLQTKGESNQVSFMGMIDFDLTASYVTPNAKFNNEDLSNSRIGYAQQRYVTSSGEVFWIFILRDKITKNIIKMYQAPDHPCFGNGGKPLLVPHPFGSYDSEMQEIIVINPSHEDVVAMKKRGERGEDELDKDLLEVIMEEYEIDEMSKPPWPTKAVTVGLPKDYESKGMG